jgi:hypothetical protein
MPLTAVEGNHVHLLKPGEKTSFNTPSGARINITMLSNGLAEIEAQTPTSRVTKFMPLGTRAPLFHCTQTGVVKKIVSFENL